MVERLKIVVMLAGRAPNAKYRCVPARGVASAAFARPPRSSELDPGKPDWILPPKTDAVFLALHGTYGEDGTVQRQLEKLGVLYTGCDAESSRISFDKVLTNQRCIAARVPTAKFLVVEFGKRLRGRRIGGRRWW